MNTWIRCILFYKGLLYYLATSANKYEKLVEIDVTLNLKLRYYWQKMKKHKYTFLLAKTCKHVILQINADTESTYSTLFI